MSAEQLFNRWIKWTLMLFALVCALQYRLWFGPHSVKEYFKHQEELKVHLTSNLELTGILGYTDAKFNEVVFFDAASQTNVDVSDVWSFANTPEWTGTLGLKYTQSAGIGEIVYNVMGSYRADTQIFEVPSVLDFGGYTLFNAGATWYSNDGHWDLSAQVRNIGDKETRIAGYNFPLLAAEQTITAYYGDPRNVMFNVKYSF